MNWMLLKVGMGNGEWGTRNEKRETRKGERQTVNEERGTGSREPELERGNEFTAVI